MVDLSQLWPHQKETFEFGKDLPAFADCSSAGTGKGLAHAKIAEYFLSNGGSRVVITAPKTLIRSAWQTEFFTRLPDVKIALAEAPEANRKDAFESDAEVVLLNVDGFTFLAKQSDKWLKNHLGTKALLINDESTTLKNPEANRTKAAMKVAPYFVKKHIMSGTMCPNSITEIFSQIKLIDSGERLGKRYTNFRNMFTYPVKRGPFTTFLDKPDAADIVYGLLKDILIRHPFDLVMPHVPRMDHRIIYYDLPIKHKDIYDELYRNSFLKYEGKNISAINKAALAGKLLQCASGAMYNDADGQEKTWSTIDSGRYELLGDLVEGRDHTVVFFLWKHQKEELIKQCKKRGLSYSVIDGDISSSEKRDEAVKQMQEGKLRVLLLHPLSASHGITLTKSTTVIFASPTYNADWYIQGTARIRRGVQSKITESIIILARDTRDFDAYEVFTNKKDRMEALNSLFERKV